MACLMAMGFRLARYAVTRDVPPMTTETIGFATKYDNVTHRLEKEIAPLDIAHWTDPNGGYFVSLYAMPGTAQRIWKLCKEAGVVLTNAGAAYPYRKDPDDSHLRIAPSLPPVEELEKAMEVLTTAMKLSALEKMLNK